MSNTPQTHTSIESTSICTDSNNQIAPSASTIALTDDAYERGYQDGIRAIRLEMQSRSNVIMQELAEKLEKLGFTEEYQVIIRAQQEMAV